MPGNIGRSAPMRSPKIYGCSVRKLLDQAMLDREVDQFGAVLDSQCFHQAILVILDGAR
jgi:hypothetical protein